MVFTFFYATKHAKALTLGESLDFLIKEARDKEEKSVIEDKLEQSEFIEKIPEENGLQVFQFGIKIWRANFVK